MIPNLGYSETVEVLVLNSAVQKYSFPDNQTNLDNALIHGISISSELTKSLKGKDVLPTAEAVKGFITLADIANKEYNALLPLAMLLQNTLSLTVMRIKPRMFNIRGSVIELPQIGAYVGIPAGGMVVCITFFYTPFNPTKHVLNGIGELEYENI